MKHFRQGTIMGFGETWTRRKSTQNLKHPHTSDLEANVRVVYVKPWTCNEDNIKTKRKNKAS